MRSTIHMVSAADYWLLAAGVGPSLQEWRLRTQGGGGAGDFDLGRRRPSSGRCSPGRSGPARIWMSFSPRWDLRSGPASGFRWSGSPLRARGSAEPTCSSWRRSGWDPRTPRRTRAWSICCAATSRLRSGNPGRRRLVGRCPVGRLAGAAQRLPLRTFRGPAGTELIDLSRAPLPPVDVPAPPRFLGTWDAALLVHCRRA